MLKLGELAGLGGIVPAEPVKKHIEFGIIDAETGEVTDYDVDIWVVRIAVAEYEKLGTIQADKKKKDDPQYMANLISTCVRLGDNADEVIPFETALRFNPAMAVAMVVAINEVNGLGKKTLAPTKNSGSSSSPPESAGEQSGKQKKT